MIYPKMLVKTRSQLISQSLSLKIQCNPKQNSLMDSYTGIYLICFFVFQHGDVKSLLQKYERFRVSIFSSINFLRNCKVN